MKTFNKTIHTLALLVWAFVVFSIYINVLTTWPRTQRLLEELFRLSGWLDIGFWQWLSRSLIATLTYLAITTVLIFSHYIPLNWCLWNFINTMHYLHVIVIFGAYTALFTTILILLLCSVKACNEEIKLFCETYHLKKPAMLNALFREQTKIRELCGEADSIFSFCVLQLTLVSLCEALSLVNSSFLYGTSWLQAIMWFLSTGINIIIILTAIFLLSCEVQSTVWKSLIAALNIDDEQLNGILEEYSLNYQHLRMEFTGGGLVKLNLTLLASMVGAIGTYGVILMQFSN